MELNNMALVAGYLITILTFIGMIIKPILNINKTIVEIMNTLKTLNKEIDESRNDRLNIHDKLEKLKETQNSLKEKVIINTEHIKTLFKRKDEK